ncbi:bifunctional 5,10-methylenetetrahydrofolate dehydrogenase/5,10-methenyltetrahydrofolate cyclohydrolase [Alkaliphilus serpentinus]|uniref:Bifunctional protein FolD n=1 Tax=Alkaliphilus serpentinus TaxID=1482731 RepID=A0A833M9K0_9FIRM|nr:bifunctional 5,10-methylenetetrahydrofolate dehydrogenase/5,10-methenyltetrahydrofolate cyclohydrolase [Alkaliphilus serpentinus]KAB3530045.1 bifunctional 5,10-methylenetetrahydrofolate dehydrogenase/5,10-methenyltetrahydrofolate cyclohydrolase [Alkaliphilus serpentinus]
MAMILKGKPVVEALKEDLRREISSIREEGIVPTLGIIRVGNRPDDVAYENSVIKNCKSVDLHTEVFDVGVDITMEDFTAVVKDVNANANIHGILMFRPLPSHLDINAIKHLIDPQKDIDCMNPMSLAKVFEGCKDGFAPCTPKAVIEMLKFNDIPLRGGNVVIINSSLVVGRPLGMMMIDNKATITICHSATKNLPEVASRADIVITAVGRRRMFDESYFNKDAVVIDVGINDDGEGGICGDVDYHKVQEKVKAITPVPGGVGTVTTAILMKHVVEACKLQKA